MYVQMPLLLWSSCVTKAWKGSSSEDNLSLLLLKAERTSCWKVVARYIFAPHCCLRLYPCIHGSVPWMPAGNGAFTGAPLIEDVQLMLTLVLEVELLQV